MSKRIKITALILTVAVFAALAGGCVFGGTTATYKIEYELCDNGEAVFDHTPDSYSAAARDVALELPVRKGYVFKGWSLAPNDVPNAFSAIAAGTRGDLTLYANWEPAHPSGVSGAYAETDTWHGFLPYVEEFDAAYAKSSAGSVVIDSRDELTAYCEYVQYKYITVATAPTVTVAYEYESRNLSSEIRSVIDGAYFASYIGLSWSVASATQDSVCIGVKYNDYIGREGSLTCDDSDYYTQIRPYAYNEAGAPHAFAIDGVTATLNCETSNQLFYAAMTGARPVPVAGSVAAELYGEARAVLTDIIYDGMADYEKAQAIYEWLVMNVTYDEAVIASNVKLPEAIAYDAFYLEGVFGSGRAVCDGISKAMTLLCRIEGIPCVRVVGADHAWNKVCVQGRWYIADATFGDTGTKFGEVNYSFLSHRSFLVSESANARYGEAENYTAPEYAASVDFGFYNDRTLGGVSLVVRSAADFLKLYRAASGLHPYAYSLDFYVTDENYVTKRPCAFDPYDNRYCTLFFNM